MHALHSLLRAGLIEQPQVKAKRMKKRYSIFVKATMAGISIYTNQSLYKFAFGLSLFTIIYNIAEGLIINIFRF